MPHIKPKIESMKDMREGFKHQAVLQRLKDEAKYFVKNTDVKIEECEPGATYKIFEPLEEALLNQIHYWLKRYLSKRWWQSKSYERQMLKLIVSRIEEIIH